MTYLDIVALVSEGVRPDQINPQIWRRMQRVANDYKLMLVSPDVLPDSLCALIELTRLSEPRIRLLDEYGLMGRGLTAKRVRELGPDGPIKVYTETTLYPDGRIELGQIVTDHTM